MQFFRPIRLQDAASHVGIFPEHTYTADERHNRSVCSLDLGCHPSLDEVYRAVYGDWDLETLTEAFRYTDVVVD